MPLTDPTRAVETAQRCCATVVQIAPPAAGARGRRLWELDDHAHCPVLGVCLPVPALRRVVDKVLGGQTQADDYELHCGAVGDSKRRTRLAEVLHKALDQRHAGALRRAAPLKTGVELFGWGPRVREGAGLAAAFWAVMTHARCTPAIERAVLGDVHMRQHQLGHRRDHDARRADALQLEHRQLREQLAAVQARAAAQRDEHAVQQAALQAELLGLRGQLLGRDALLSQLDDEVQALRQAQPELPQRQALVEQLNAQGEQLRDVRRALGLAQQRLAELQRRAAPRNEPAADGEPSEAAPRPSDEAGTALDSSAVLCVGGRTASVPVYRRLIEARGGRFLHHDGGDEDNVQRLESTLAAADLVICQVGCISHDAYWRVKDHCKRHGKRCVFVDSPSSAGLQRALAEARPR